MVSLPSIHILFPEYFGAADCPNAVLPQILQKTTRNVNRPKFNDCPSATEIHSGPPYNSNSAPINRNLTSGPGLEGHETSESSNRQSSQIRDPAQCLPTPNFSVSPTLTVHSSISDLCPQQNCFSDVLQHDRPTVSPKHIFSCIPSCRRKARMKRHSQYNTANGSTPSFAVTMQGSEPGASSSSIISFSISDDSNPSLGPRVKSVRSANRRKEDKRHACDICAKFFSRPSSLRIHLNTHTGATPFKCAFASCGRQFNVKSNLRRHLMSNHRTSIQGDLVKSAEEASFASTQQSPTLSDDSEMLSPWGEDISEYA